MMKIIATADWHLGNMFHGNDRLAEQRHFLEWLKDTLQSECPDVLVVAGDVFDNGNPSAAAQTLYYEFLDTVTGAMPSLHIVITAGNHDSPHRLEAPRPIMERHRVHIRGKVRRHWQNACDDVPGRWINDLDDLIIPVGEGKKGIILAVPYLRSDIAAGDSYGEAVREFLAELTARGRELYPEVPLVMASHLYATGAVIPAHSSERIVVGGQEQVSLGGWENHPDYLISGHIHRRQKLGLVEWARYPGSVLPMSFAEKDYHHGVDRVIVSDDGAVSVEQIVYEPQRPLLIIPEEGMQTRRTATQTSKIIESMLQDRIGEIPTEDAPFVMLYLYQPKVNADKKRELEDLIASKNAVLCGTQSITEAVVSTLSGNETLRTVADIVERDPMETLEEAYRMRHEQDMPEHRRTLLTELLNSITEQPTP